MKDEIQIKRALVSVYDKKGVLELATMLKKFSVEILSTGGTAAYLQENGIPVTSVSDVTGFPEILGGRVKTLHPKIHGAILAKRDDDSQMTELQQHDIEPIDLVVINLYPFEKTVAKPDVSLSEALENIDIGGPTMIRAAAKNFPGVAVVTSPDQYKTVISELEATAGALTLATRQKLATEAFRLTSTYDLAITNYLSSLAEEEQGMPESLNIMLKKVQDLRYGENPHQQAAFYTDKTVYENELGKKLHGKELSFNNILDMNAAVGLVSEFKESCVVILKHNNPCGVAIDEDIVTAYRNALATDPVSAFGGIVAFNRQVNAKVAELMSKVFLEVILAPSFSDEALSLLTKKKNIRLVEIPRLSLDEKALDIKRVYAGYLLQNMDLAAEPTESYRVVTKRQPETKDWQAMQFGWKVVKWVKSNAVIFVSDKMTLGIGAGQMSRVDSSKLAVMKAKDAGLSLEGSVVVSDAFFPFRDGIDAAAQAGAIGVIQPGGSIRDQEVIDAANEHGMFMVFTGIRHFRH